MEWITINSNDGRTYSIVATDDGDNHWTASIAEVGADGGVKSEILSDDEFYAEFGDTTYARAALQMAVGKVIF